MSKIEVAVMFLITQALALWGLWDIPSIDVNGQALLLAFLTLEGAFVLVWLAMAFLIAPGVVWTVDKFQRRNG